MDGLKSQVEKYSLYLKVPQLPQNTSKFEGIKNKSSCCIVDLVCILQLAFQLLNFS